MPTIARSTHCGADNNDNRGDTLNKTANNTNGGDDDATHGSNNAHVNSAARKANICFPHGKTKQTFATLAANKEQKRASAVALVAHKQTNVTNAAWKCGSATHKQMFVANTAKQTLAAFKKKKQKQKQNTKTTMLGFA